MQVRHVQIFGDSRLVVKQLANDYQCLDVKLKRYHSLATKLMKQFDRVTSEHVPRKLNQEANDL